MIRFAVVGLGHIGKRHAEMIRRNPNAELVAVCDVLPKEKIDPEKITIITTTSFSNVKTLT